MTATTQQTEQAALLIWGAGAIGGTIGAHLARAGEDVLLVDTAADHVAAMRAEGLAIEGPIETFTVPVHAVLPADLKESGAISAAGSNSAWASGCWPAPAPPTC